jgi:hypothetical protein
VNLLDIAQGLQQLGIVGFLGLSITVILVGLYREWWYPRPYVKRLEAELAEAKALNKQAANITEKAVDRVPPAA